MDKFTEIIPILGFILSLFLFGYSLKKFFLKVEKNKNWENFYKSDIYFFEKYIYLKFIKNKIVLFKTLKK